MSFYETLATIDFGVAMIAAIIALFVLNAISRKDEKNKSIKILMNFFIIIALAYLIWALAEGMYAYITYIYGHEVYPSLADPVYVLGYLLESGAFVYLLLKVKNKDWKRTALWLAMLVLILIPFQLWFITSFIFPYSEGSAYAKFFDLFYPIASSVFLLLAATLFLQFRQYKIKLPMLLLAVGAVFAFVGDMIFSYYSWLDIHTVYPIVSEIMYITDYSLGAAAMILFYLWLKRDNKTEKQKERGKNGKKDTGNRR